MESLVIVSNIILVALTGFYAWFTYKTLQEVQQENTLYRNTLEKQLRLSTLPHLYCDMHCDVATNRTSLSVYNIGSVPAYDVHVSLIGAYTEEGMDIPSFMRSYVQPRYRKYPLQVDKVGYYGVRSSIRFSFLPSQKKLEVNLVFPVRPVDVYAMVQYREILGENYYQVYCFSDLDEQGTYRANILEPRASESIERFHFYDLDDASFPTSEKTIPYYVGDFVDLWNHSLSHKLTAVFSEEIVLHKDVHDA